MPLAQLADPWQKMPLGRASGEVRQSYEHAERHLLSSCRADRQLSDFQHGDMVSAFTQVPQKDTVQEVARKTPKSGIYSVTGDIYSN